MLPYQGVMAWRSGRDPADPFFGALAGRLSLTRSGHFWPLGGGYQEFGRPCFGRLELEVVGQYYPYEVGIARFLEVQG